MSEDERANQGTAMMRTGLISFGRVSLLVGVLLIAANVAMNFMGLSTSYNIGDSSKDQFFLISFWHIGAALAIIGVVAVFAGKQN
jgi:ABC-type spermidine/putrescine transport system permease subunit I